MLSDTSLMRTVFSGEADLRCNSLNQSICSAHNDTLERAGANELHGGRGDDNLVARGDIDLFGEDGNDILSVHPNGSGRLETAIFNGGEGTDTLDLSGFAGTLSFVGTDAFAAANQVRAVQGGANVLVQINTIGIGIAEAEIFLANTDIARVDASDFILRGVRTGGPTAHAARDCRRRVC